MMEEVRKGVVEGSCCSRSNFVVYRLLTCCLGLQHIGSWQLLALSRILLRGATAVLCSSGAPELQCVPDVGRRW